MIAGDLLAGVAGFHRGWPWNSTGGIAAAPAVAGAFS